MKNKRVLTGTFAVCSESIYPYGEIEDNTNPCYTNEGVTRLFKKSCVGYYNYQNHPTKVLVFKDISLVQPVPKNIIENDRYIPIYNFTAPSDAILIDTSDIFRITFIKKEYAYHQGEIGIYASKRVKNKLINKRYIHSTRFSFPSYENQDIEFDDGGSFSVYNVFSYNPNLSLTQVQNLIRARFAYWQIKAEKDFTNKHTSQSINNSPRLQKKYIKYMLKQEKKARRYFRRKGILILYEGSYC